jgi:hypothetical protein
MSAGDHAVLAGLAGLLNLRVRSPASTFFNVCGLFLTSFRAAGLAGLYP